MEITRELKRIVGVAVSLACIGCAGTRIVEDADRDTSRQYDGTWAVNIEANARKQAGPGRWIMNCGDMSGTTAINVNDGVAHMYYDAKQHKANVARDGSFRLEVPTEHRQRSASPWATLDKGGVTLIFEGRLAGNNPSGRLTHGIEEFNNFGCNTKVVYARKE